MAIHSVIVHETAH